MAPSQPTPKQGENLRRLRNSPVCIICARPGEAETIAKGLGILDDRLRSHDVADVPNDHTFYCGQLMLTDGSLLDYYVTSSTRQGIQSFTVQTALLAHILRPRFIIHAGVCAGRDTGKIHLGDVIFGESALNIEEGKHTVTKDGLPKFLPEYHTVDVRIGDMQAFADDGARTGVHYGDYITGSAVREDAQKLFKWISPLVDRKIIALDMEASAFLELCRYFLKDSTCLGVVKGVSDMGDLHKGADPDHKQIALLNTASALRQWIIYSIPGRTWEVDYSREPAAEIESGYYDNFVRRVLDNVSQGLPVTRKHVNGQTGHLTPIDTKAIRGLKIVLPHNNNPMEYKGLGPISGACNRHNIIEVEVGGDHGKRGLYYKSGYLIDFPRTVNRYADTYDAQHQVMVFGELLKKREWLRSSTDSLCGTVVSWEEFNSWAEVNQDPVIFEEPDHKEPDNKEPVTAVRNVERSPSPPSVSGEAPKAKSNNKRGFSLGWPKKYSVRVTATTWGNLGHRTIALLAQRHLSPAAKVYVQSLLGPIDISDAAIWADDFKFSPEGRHTGSWHFVDAKDDPPDYCNVSAIRDCSPSRLCILQAISDQNKLLLERQLDWDKRHRAFLFLIHLIGDLHHPLHVESIARGGNDINVKFDGRNRSLHFIWDVSIPQKITSSDESGERLVAEAWAAELFHRAVHPADLTDCMALVGPGFPSCGLGSVDRSAASSILLQWARETNTLVCTYVLRDGVARIKDQELSGAYFEGAVPIVEDLIVKAAVRLAAWIEWLVAQQHEFK